MEKRYTSVLTVSVPPAVVKEANRVAKSENRTRSELFREALRFYISQKKWAQIRGWGTEAAKKLNLKTEQDVERLIQGIR